MENKSISTIGHSTHTIEEFCELLRTHAIQLLVDVRTIPRSRAHPQLSGDLLSAALRTDGIDYCHLKALGGLRHPTKNAPNTDWHHASFRSFADDMATPAFQAGFAELEELACRKRSTIMCAEALPWRCHCSLIADVLTVASWHVYHIMSKHTVKEHTLTSFLRVEGGMLIYPGEEGDALSYHCLVASPPSLGNCALGRTSLGVTKQGGGQETHRLMLK
jgi:uncharacterized protein (DUF488 family)